MLQMVFFSRWLYEPLAGPLDVDVLYEPTPLLSLQLRQRIDENPRKMMRLPFSSGNCSTHNMARAIKSCGCSVTDVIAKISPPTEQRPL